MIASNQLVLRIDKEIKTKVNGDTLKKLLQIIEDNISDVNLIILSDYDKGLITRKLVQETVSLARKHDVITLADPKSLNFSKYENVSILTPNKKEASLAANMDLFSMEDLYVAGQKIIDQVKLERLLITCGKDGMVLFEKNNAPFTIESKARQVLMFPVQGARLFLFLGLALHLELHSKKVP